MQGTILSICYLLTALFAGIAAAGWVFPKEDRLLRFSLGCGFGVSFLAGFPALFALVFGFKLPALLCALVVFVLIAVCAVRFSPQNKLFFPDKKRMIGFLLCVLPLFLFTCFLLNTHVLHQVGDTLHTGQSCYGDLPMHLGFIKYIANTGEFPPHYPLLAGENRFGYPFLCETVSSVFLVLGADLRTAYLLPELPAFLSIYGMFWLFAERITGNIKKAVLAFWLFFLGSGFGFAYFMDSRESFESIFTGFYTTPTNYTVENIVWVNPVADLLIPQRATLFGWSILFPALYLLWCFCFEEERRLWLPLAVLVLPLPLCQTHSGLALALISLAGGIYTLIYRPRTKKVLLPWFSYATLCCVVWFAQMWGTVLAQSVDGQNMLRLHFNWVNNAGDGTLKNNYFWFYIKNIGLVYLLLVPAFFHAKIKQRWLYVGGVLIWALAEVVLFQPNPYDNNKLLFIWHLLGCILVSDLIVDVCTSLSRLSGGFLLALCVFAGTFGSVLTLEREAVSDYQHWSADDISAAAYVDEESDVSAVFLTSDTHTTPFFALAGRQIVCGSGSYVYYHGMDYADEYQAMIELYRNPTEELLAEWGVNYVVFDYSVYNLTDPDEGWYTEHYPLWYSNDTYRIYKIE